MKFKKVVNCVCDLFVFHSLLSNYLVVCLFVLPQRMNLSFQKVVVIIICLYNLYIK